MFGDVTTGASDDLKRVTQMAYSMVRIYGMNDKVGNLARVSTIMSKPSKKGLSSDATAQLFDEEAKVVIGEAYDRTKEEAALRPAAKTAR